MIDSTITLGTLNRLRLDRFAPPGAYLMASDDADVLLPNQYVTDDMVLDQELEVFIYTDSEDRLVATTQHPLAMRDQFGFFEVVDVADFGAFVDWGLPKDLFVPKNRQKTPMRIGEKRFLRVVEDPQTNRLIGIEKISAYLERAPHMYPNTPVSLLVIAKTPLGFKTIVNDRYEGMLYHNEIFTPIAVGLKIDGYVKQVRNDGLIDALLQPMGTKRTASDAQKVLDLLDAHRGILPYNYKTDPDTITSVFGMSRKAFKRVLTELIDAETITVGENGIHRK
ncbi:MAG: DNA-binding protein [Campylobacterales bacterium]|nr:DNA-binding protein [Campylobacterales bacterium]